MKYFITLRTALTRDSKCSLILRIHYMLQQLSKSFFIFSLSLFHTKLHHHCNFLCYWLSFSLISNTCYNILHWKQATSHYDLQNNTLLLCILPYYVQFYICFMYYLPLQNEVLNKIYILRRVNIILQLITCKIA